MTWINTPTPLNAGPLGSNSYTMNITGLSASTIYCYRAYFIVDGVEYYGDILTGTTASITYTAPTVITGNAIDVLYNKFNVVGNKLSSNGGAPIIEYGTLYTQLAHYGNSANLICNNYPANVSKVSTISDVPSIPYEYSGNITGLNANTTTYYRAFAKNAFGISYGTVKTQVTEAPPSSDINIDVNITWDMPSQCGADDGFDGAYGLYCCNGILVKSCTASLYTKNLTSNWSVPAGCYYVDFSALNARVNGLYIVWDFYWSIAGCCTGQDCCTTCFNSSVSIYANLPMALV